MLNKTKLLSEVESEIYTSENKVEADKLMSKYIGLINSFNSTKYIFSIKKYPLTILIKHKSHNKKLTLQLINKNWYLNNKLVSLKYLEKTLDYFFSWQILKNDL